MNASLECLLNAGLCAKIICLFKVLFGSSNVVIENVRKMLQQQWNSLQTTYFKTFLFLNNDIFR